MKKLFKIIFIAFVYAVVNSTFSVILPYSQGFKQVSSGGDPSRMLYMFLYSLFSAFFISYIVINSSKRDKFSILSLIISIFIVQGFQVQIEALFFGAQFPAISKIDTALLMLANLITVTISVMVTIKLFKEESEEVSTVIHNFKSILFKLLMIGGIYVIVYFVFGYFVAWQFVSVREFYSGSNVKVSFMQQLIVNAKTNPIIYPFQFIRGIIFGISTLLLYRLLINKHKELIIANVLCFVSMGVILLMPNPLFPDGVRIGHFYEVTSSMLLFGVVTPMLVMSKNKLNRIWMLRNSRKV